MTLHETIAKRNRLEKEIEVLKERINKWNVVKRNDPPIVSDDMVANTAPRPFDLSKEMHTLGNKMDALIDLKLAIHTAYSDIQEVIIKRQEAESYLVFLQCLNLKEGYYGECDKAIDELKQMALIENIEAEIDSLTLAISKFEFEKVL